MDMLALWREADRCQEELVTLRRDFHHYAESGWSEFRTTAKIIEYLRAHGLTVSFGRDVLDLDYAWAYPE